MKNKRIFKNILISILLALSSNFAFANSCIMVSPENICEVSCPDKQIVEIHTLTTLNNEKKSIVLTAVNDGETSLCVKLKHKKCDYKIAVSCGKIKIKGDRYIKILDIDLPPEFTQSEGDCK